MSILGLAEIKPKAEGQATFKFTATKTEKADGTPVEFEFHHKDSPQGVIVSRRISKLFMRLVDADRFIDVDTSEEDLDATFEKDIATSKRALKWMLAGWNLSDEANEANIELLCSTPGFEPLVAEATQAIVAHIFGADASGK